MGEIRGAHLAPLLLAVAVATLTFVIRLFRWRLLLRADDGSALPAGPLWHAVAIGFMADFLEERPAPAAFHHQPAGQPQGADAV